MDKRSIMCNCTTDGLLGVEYSHRGALVSADRTRQVMVSCYVINVNAAPRHLGHPVAGCSVLLVPDLPCHIAANVCSEENPPGDQGDLPQFPTDNHFPVTPIGHQQFHGDTPRARDFNLEVV